MQDVADHVGVLKGSLYHYIDSKEDLLFRIFDESHHEAKKIADEVRASGRPPIEQLYVFFERYVRWYLDHVERVSLYLNEWRFLTGDRLETVRKQRRIYETFVRGLIEDAQATGDLHAGIPTWYRRGGKQAPAQIAEAFADMVVGTLVGTTPGGGTDGAKRPPAKKSAVRAA
jgi:AcrR family transcriptional regulator